MNLATNPVFSEELYCERLLKREVELRSSNDEIKLVILEEIIPEKFRAKIMLELEYFPNTKTIVFKDKDLFLEEMKKIYLQRKEVQIGKIDFRLVFKERVWNVEESPILVCRKTRFAEEMYILI